MARKAQYQLRHIDQDDEEVEDRSSDIDIPIGIYGWKKRLLYFCILLLLVVILVNLALTVWIMVALNFSVFGVGSVVFTSFGLRVDGRAVFPNDLSTSSLVANQDTSLELQSQVAVSVSAGNSSQLHIQGDFVNVTSSDFRVRLPTQAATDPDLLSVTENGISVGADMLEVKGQRGMSVSGSVSASQLSGHPSQDLQLSAPSGRLQAQGAEGVTLEAPVGGVNVTAGGDIRIQSNSGPITFEAADMKITGLLLSDSSSPTANSVYQVCACSSGKLYLAPSDGQCQPGTGSTICT